MLHEVVVSESPARTAAERFAQFVIEQERVHVAVSGGSTPRDMFRFLATDLAAVVPWDRIQIYQVDERCVPPTSHDSNWRMLNEELLVHVPGVKAFRMEAERRGAAQDYEALLRGELPGGGPVPELDLVMLGMGADGHTASLFPGTAALAESERLVVRNDVPQLGVQRVTMTFPLINAANARWFLVRGGDKAPAYARVMDGENVPAGQLKDARWFVDPSVTP